MRCAALLLVLLAFLPGVAYADGGWLDTAPQNWNQPGAPVPRAQPTNVLPQQICLRQERAAAGPEEQQLAASGWKLEEYWPARREGDLTLVTALSDYDGMCRPWRFNAFVFAGGRFAGTLSPSVMDSRIDGVLTGTPEVLADGTVRARFLRYAQTDPLCCPSRPSNLVTYRVDRTPAGPVLAVAGVTVIPNQMPNTGERPVPVSALGLLGAGLVMMGFVMKRPRTEPRP